MEKEYDDYEDDDFEDEDICDDCGELTEDCVCFENEISDYSPS